MGAIADSEHFDRYGRLLLRGINRAITLTLRTAIAIEHDFDLNIIENNKIPHPKDVLNVHLATEMEVNPACTFEVNPAADLTNPANA